METWNDAAVTSVSFFWKALWGFALGYVISSLIQVLVTRSRMQSAMGESGPRSVALGGFFGFISSSCSFAALASTRAIMKKGAGLVPALAFLLASTNLVVELGVVIAIFLGWQFVVAEYVGGILLILLMWLFVRLTYPTNWMKDLRTEMYQKVYEEPIYPKNLYLDREPMKHEEYEKEIIKKQVKLMQDRGIWKKSGFRRNKE